MIICAEKEESLLNNVKANSTYIEKIKKDSETLIKIKEEKVEDLTFNFFLIIGLHALNIFLTIYQKYV